MRRPRRRRMGFPLLFLAATLLAAVPVQASEASNGDPVLLVHPTHVASDGSPFSVRVGVHGEPGARVEVKLWVGSEHRQASQTWTGTGWLRADRYAVTASLDGNGSWRGWVHGRVNPESAGFDDLVAGRDDARLSLRVRPEDGSASGTVHRRVKLLHGDDAVVVRAPSTAALAAVRGPDGRWASVAPVEPDGLPDGDPPLPGWVRLPVPAGWRGHAVALSSDGSSLGPVPPSPAPRLRLAETVVEGYASDEPLEMVTLLNRGRGVAELPGACLHAGGGRACFLEGARRLDPGERVVVARDAALWRNATGTSARDLDRLWKRGGFHLPDDGGRVEVRFLDRLVDAWTVGDPPPFPGEVRVRDRDPDARRLRVGQSRLSAVPVEVSGTAWPGLAPASSYGLLHHVLQSAERSVVASVYLLTSPEVAWDLADALDRGVEVHLLVDGSPVGGVPEVEQRVLQGLRDRGAEVHVLESGDAFRRRYSALHAKAAVVDGEVVVVGSENWARSSHPPGGTWGNRGWVLAVRNRSLAGTVEAVLRGDAVPVRPDVHPVAAGGAGLPPRRLARAPDPPAPVVLRNASVELLVAPDTALPGVVELLRGARRSLDVELLSLERDWDGEPSPLVRELVAAARRGVHVRVLLDGTYVDPATGAPRNAPARDLLQRVAAREGLPLEVRIWEGGTFLKVHSKGVVVDGERVLVGSMNWGEASMLRNREVGLVVDHVGVARVYGEAFHALWRGREDAAWGPVTPPSAVPTVGVSGVLAVAVLAARLRKGRRRKEGWPTAPR